MKMKTEHKLTRAELRKLFRAADEARARVSGYSDEQRAELEAQARAKIHNKRNGK
jgi:hypothetical protein